MLGHCQSAGAALLLAMFLGMGFHTGFIVEQDDMWVIAKQLHQLMVHGLLDRQQNGRSLAITPPVPAAAVAVGEVPHAWPGLMV
jgi:hypothetical protein